MSSCIEGRKRYGNTKIRSASQRKSESKNSPDKFNGKVSCETGGVAVWIIHAKLWLFCRRMHFHFPASRALSRWWCGPRNVLGFGARDKSLVAAPLCVCRRLFIYTLIYDLVNWCLRKWYVASQVYGVCFHLVEHTRENSCGRERSSAGCVCCCLRRDFYKCACERARREHGYSLRKQINQCSPRETPCISCGESNVLIRSMDWLSGAFYWISTVRTPLFDQRANSICGAAWEQANNSKLESWSENKHRVVRDSCERCRCEQG
jgi:hypothetical protein